MGLETIVVILSFTALAVLAMLVGRLLATLIKIGLVVGFLYFVLTRFAGPGSALCARQTARAGNSAVLSGFFCKP